MPRYQISVFTTSTMKDYHNRLALLYLVLSIHACQVYAEYDEEPGSSEGGESGLWISFPYYYLIIDPKYPTFSQVQTLRRKMKVILKKKSLEAEMLTPPTLTKPPLTAVMVRPGTFGTNYRRTLSEIWPEKSSSTLRPTNSSRCISKL